MCPNRLLPLLILLLAGVPTTGAEPISATEALGRAGEKATVQFKVESSRLLTDRERPLCFLNSRRNYRDDDNLTIVVYEEGLKRFKEKKIDNPAEHYYHKTIQVTGEIALRQGKPQIVIEYPDQIMIIEKPQP